MAAKVNVRVEARDLSPNASFYEKEAEFRRIFSLFRLLINREGVLKAYKKKEHFESDSRRTRRLRREAERQRLKLEKKGNKTKKKKNKRKKKSNAPQQF